MAEMIQASYHGGEGNLPPIRQVIHCTAPGIGYPAASAKGQAVGTARYFQTPATGGSAHWVFDIAEAVRCLADSTVGYHAPPNPHSLGYEICGEVTYTREQWLSPEVWPAVVDCAAQVKADAHKYGIPIHKLTVAETAADHAGQCGHVDVSEAFHQSDHTDPGPNFPWDRFMALLTDQQEADVALSDDDVKKIGDYIYERYLKRAVAYLAGHGENQAFNASTVGSPPPKPQQ